MSLQQRMRISRENAGLNQEEMAKKIGIGRATYAKTEQGVREPRRGELLAIAAITGVDSHWLATGEVPEAGENWLNKNQGSTHVVDRWSFRRGGGVMKCDEKIEQIENIFYYDLEWRWLPFRCAPIIATCPKLGVFHYFPSLF